MTEAQELLSQAVNTLADPCDACDFEDSEADALRQTISDALFWLQKLSAELKRQQEPEKLNWWIGGALLLFAVIWCGVIYTGCQYSTAFCTGVRAFFGVR